MQPTLAVFLSILQQPGSLFAVATLQRCVSGEPVRAIGRPLGAASRVIDALSTDRTVVLTGASLSCLTLAVAFLQAHRFTRTPVGALLLTD